MAEPLPVVRLKNAWKSTHPWIFQRLVEKPAQRPKPGSIVDVTGVDGVFIGRGFYNGHSRIALRMLESNPDIEVDAGWFERKLAEAVQLRRDILKLEQTSNAWRVFHSEGDGISGLVVDRYDDLLVVEFFSAGAYRHREWIFNALREHFPGCRFHSFADEHVQKQESFDYKDTQGTEPAIVTEHGIKFRADPAGAHTTGFFADQRENREWLSRMCTGQRVLDLCCNTGGFGVYAAVRGAEEVVGIDIDPAVLEIARGNAKLNGLHGKAMPRFIQADIFPWLRDAQANGERFDVVILDPAKMTRDREQVIPALKKYLDMNKAALGVVKPGGLFATFSCTGLVSEESGLVRAGRIGAELQAVFADDGRLRAQRGLVIEALLLLHVLVGEAVEAAAGKLAAQDIENPFAVAPGAGAEEFHHQQIIVAVHHQPAEAVAFAVHHPPGVADGIELEEFAAQAHSLADLAHEPAGIDRHVRVVLQHAQGDPRVAVVEAAADPGPVHPGHVHDAARLRPLRGFFDQPLEDPRVGGVPGVLEADQGQGLGHGGWR